MQLVLRDHQAHKETLVRKEQRDRKDHKVQQVRLAHLVHKALLVRRDLRVQLDHKVLRGHKA